MTPGRIESRLGSLEAAQAPRDPDAELQFMADQFGLTLDELHAENDAVVEMCRRAGAESLAACIDVLAADAGVNSEAVRAEMATWRDWGRTR